MTDRRAGEASHKAQHNNQTVRMAKHARALGMPYEAIGRQLGGVPWQTVARWCKGETRNKAGQ